MLVPVKELELIDYMRMPRDKRETGPRMTPGTRTFRASETTTLFADYEHRVMHIGSRRLPFEQVQWWEDELAKAGPLPEEEPTPPKGMEWAGPAIVDDAVGTVRPVRDAMPPPAKTGKRRDGR